MSEEDKTGTLTRLLRQAGSGDAEAESRLCEMVYGELREAAGRMCRDAGSSIQPTMLVHELWLKLRDALGDIPNRRYFFAVAIDQMRKILIGHHRKRKTQKRGGHFGRLPLDDVLDHLLDEFEEQNQFDIEALDDALQRLKQQQARQYEVVRYRFFGGFTIQETAELLETSVGTVERDWRLARAKLYAQLRTNC